MRKSVFKTYFTRPIALVVIFVLLGTTAYVFYHNFHLSSALEEKESSLAQKGEQLHQLQQLISDFKHKVNKIEAENTDLSEKYEEKKELTATLSEQVEKITSSFGELKEYALADPEVLKKYSSVFFLNENYIPKNLTEIPSTYVLNDKKVELRRKVLSHFKDMAEDAKNAGNPLEIVSAYRSFGTQANLKGRYVVIYGRDTANTFSADQGYSEHQLGTTVDLTTPVLGTNFDSFDTTSAYQWMTENAYKYGFVLSYPKDNPYYKYEPWHWRFVGIELATDLNEANAYFYDWGQRKLDSYRGEVFN